MAKSRPLKMRKRVRQNCESLAEFPYRQLTNLLRLFMHGGHTNRITEFSWNKNDPWVMCSAAEDNLIECWRPARSIVNAAPIKVRNRDVEDEAVLADYR